MLRTWDRLMKRNSFVSKTNLGLNVYNFKCRQITCSPGANIKTKCKAKNTDQNSHVQFPQFNTASCFSLRLSRTTNVDQLQKDSIKFFKPYLQIVKRKEVADAAQNLVILATPSQITWLENDCVQNYLRHLFVDNSHKLPFKVNVTCACVDGLAPSVEELRNGKVENLYEGISVLLNESSDQFSDLCPTLTPLHAKIDDKCSLTFQYSFDDHAQSCQVTVPLANTIFRNGRRSTLIVSKWKVSQHGINLVEGPVYPANTSISIFTTRDKYGLQISAKSLTEPRIIEKSFGNIVRRLKSNGLGSFSASYDLEKAIAEIHKTSTSGLDNSVWALIIPSKISARVKNDSNSNCKGELDTTHLGNLVMEGAKISRVLSGGGGWGAKKGLLALDPITAFEDSNESHIEIDENFPLLKDNQKMSFGNMVQEGSLIQFLQTADKFNPASISPRKDLQHNEIVLGNQNTATSSSISMANSKYVFIPGLFGFVSETGIFLKPEGFGSTRIDMPNSYIYIG